MCRQGELFRQRKRTLPAHLYISYSSPSLYLVGQLDAQDHIHILESILARLQSIRFLRSEPTVVRTNRLPQRNDWHLRGVVIDRWFIQSPAKNFLESARPFPNGFKGRLPRWFCVTTNRLHRQVVRAWEPDDSRVRM